MSDGEITPTPALPHQGGGGSEPAVPVTPGPERRIDVTLARLADLHESASDDERAQLDGQRWWGIIILVSRLRAMERAEEEALGGPVPGLADAYDRVVSPGEPAAEALLRTFSAVYGAPVR